MITVVPLSDAQEGFPWKSVCLGAAGCHPTSLPRQGGPWKVPRPGPACLLQLPFGKPGGAALELGPSSGRSWGEETSRRNISPARAVRSPKKDKENGQLKIAP